MKPFSALTLALLMLPLVGACTAQVSPSNDSTSVKNALSSAPSSGPYLEDDSSAGSGNTVQLNVHTATSATLR